jgi:hypothetical protein
MVIKFACTHCGQGYSVPDEYWGSKFRCRHCGEQGTVPGDPELEGPPPGELELEPEDGEETSDGVMVTIKAGACPNCRAPVTEDTILCVECGLNLRTGRMTGEEPPDEPPPVAKKRQVDMTPLIKPLVTAAAALVLLVGLVILFVLVVKPMLTSSAIEDIRGLAKDGRLLDAADKFEAMAPKLAEEDEAKFMRMARMMRLQNQMIDLDPTSVGNVVMMGFFADTEGERLPRLVLRTAVKNDSAAPVELRKECFYLFGAGCVSFPEESRDEPWPEVVVAPGDMGEVILKFTAVPGPGIGMLSANPMGAVYMVYNDGENYTSKEVDLMAVLD